MLVGRPGTPRLSGPIAMSPDSRISEAAALQPLLPSDGAHERLADRVYGQLLSFIVEHALDTGDRLPSEHDLVRLTGVSRPIVREALVRLQGDGIVEPRRGSGSFVRQRPAESILHRLLPSQVQARIDSFDVRIALEPVGARLAAQGRSAAELARIKELADQLSAALAAGEPTGAIDYRLHQAIAAASHNPNIELTLQALEASLEGLIVPSLSLSLAPGDNKRHVRTLEFEHLAVVEAIERSEPEVAECAMRLHLLRARSRVIAMRW